MRGVVPWLLLAVLSACARAPLTVPSEAMRPASTPALADDLPVSTLLDAVSAQLAQFEQAARPAPNGQAVALPAVMKFGPREITRDRYIAGLRRFLELGRLYAADPSSFFAAVSREFDFLEVYGRDHWGEVLVTGYYEPVIPGSMAPTERFTQPLYGVPEDLVSVDLGAFDPGLAGRRSLRGRLSGHKLVPYYSREEIDVAGALKGRHLELCYVDPWDAFDLQIQGSGVVELENGEKLRLGYAERNGQRYESIGNFLKDSIPIEKMTMPAIAAYLHSVPRSRMRDVLNLNPSYVFFRKLDENALTFIGLPATGGRTIATDPQFFPKGALAFLATSRPGPDGAEIPVTRFVLDQDTGGAIKGGGRVDLFWGRGPEAGAVAGVMKQKGRLYYLVPKQ